MNSVINPEVAALREKVEAQGKELMTQAKEISELRGGLQQLDKIVGATTRQSIWLLIALVISLCGAIVGGLTYQTIMIDKRLEQIERNHNQRFEELEKRIEISEKNILTRFENLKQEVRAQRK